MRPHYPTSFCAALDALRGGLTRRLSANTSLAKRDDDHVAVMLHRTSIVVFRSDGAAMLNTGGWRTTTTKRRLNQCGFDVFQRDFGWYLSTRFYAEPIPFENGMIVHPNGAVRLPGDAPVDAPIAS